MTIFGWDASDYDWGRGSMDLKAAARDGIKFFSFKATEGTFVKHKHYGESLTRAKAAGIPFLGAYHVVRTGNIPEQVDYLLHYVNTETPWWRDFPGWFFQVDLERWTYDNVSAATGIAFADLLVKRTDRVALLYASQGMYGNSLSDAHHPLWNANYGQNEVGHYRKRYPGDSGRGWSSYSGKTPVIWQFGSTTTLGSQHTCDANAFRGSEADFRRLIKGGEILDPKAVAEGTVLREPDGTIAVAVGDAAFRFANWDEYLATGYHDKQWVDVPHGFLNQMRPKPKDGTLVRNHATGEIWVVAGGAKFSFSSMKELAATGYKDVPFVNLPTRYLNPLGTIMQDGTLVRNHATGMIWVVAGGAKFAFDSMEELEAAGYKGVPFANLPTRYLDTLGTIPKDGALVRNHATGEIWVVAGGAKFSFNSMEELEATVYKDIPFVNLPAHSLNSLDSIPKDGTLLRGVNDATVWQIRNGHRSAITAAPDATITVIPLPTLNTIPVEG